ncbi:MAG: glycosyltransferase family 4 protein [Candidatus Promineifilaceae bacterium]
MKIAFVSALDPSQTVRFFSGIPYHLYWALTRQAETIPVGSTVSGPPGWWRLYTRVWGRVTGLQAPWGMRPAILKELADKTAEKVSELDVDVVLTIGQGYLVFWNSPVPVASFSDLLYGSASEEDFPEHHAKPRRLNRHQQQSMKDYAQRAIDHALHVFVTSSFILDGARRFGTIIPPEKVTVTHMGANFREIPVLTMPRQQPPPLKLLWASTSWEGKGGLVALAVLDKLILMGLDVELDMVGHIPDAPTHPKVVSHGFLHKDIPEEREQLLALYRQSHLLILPTRKDTTPSGLAEAAAFGIPAITTPVGGIPGMFGEDEVVLLPFARYQEEAPAAIMNLLENGRLTKMAHDVRQRFETTLNWDVIASKIVAELTDALDM